MIMVWSLSLLSTASYAGKKGPDDFYFQQIRKIDSLTDKRLRHDLAPQTLQEYMHMAADIYVDLSGKYEIEDPIRFLYIATAASNGDGIYLACRQLISNTGYGVNKVMTQWGTNDRAALASDPVRKAMKRLYKEEQQLVSETRMRMDWEWNMELMALSKANAAARAIPHTCFKDSTAWRVAMTATDSMHLSELTALIMRKGFPYPDSVGLYLDYLKQPLLNFTTLLHFNGQKMRSIYFTEQWKMLIPGIYYATKSGRFDTKYYRFLLYNVKKQLELAGHREEAAWMEQYSL